MPRVLTAASVVRAAHRVLGKPLDHPSLGDRSRREHPDVTIRTGPDEINYQGRSKMLTEASVPFL